MQAKGPTAYPSNSVFVGEYTCGLLATSFPNMTPTQIQAAVAGMMQIEEKRAFKNHMRDFLVQVRLCSTANTSTMVCLRRMHVVWLLLLMVC